MKNLNILLLCIFGLSLSYVGCFGGPDDTPPPGYCFWVCSCSQSHYIVKQKGTTPTQAESQLTNCICNTDGHKYSIGTCADAQPK